MSAQDYKFHREQLDYTQSEIAELLGVNRVTIARRETGDAVITREAEIALLSLRKKKKSRGL